MAVVALGLGALGAAPPAGAATSDSGAIVFVPFRGQTYGVYRTGVLSYAQPFTDGSTGGQPLVGRFTGDGTEDVFVYRPGSEPDVIVDLAANPAGGADQTSIPKTVNGTFTPIVGNFNGDNRDDILWYAPGPAPDVLWLFSGEGLHTSMSVSISGTYKPTVLDVGSDGYDDVLWYAPGTATDSLWRFGDGAYHTSTTVPINGTGYQLVPGSFGGPGPFPEGVIFYNPSGPDSLWVFNDGNGYTSKPLPALDGPYEPIVGRFADSTYDRILWYRPGSAPEVLWRFTSDAVAQPVTPAPQVSGTYEPVVTDLDGDFRDDIAWTAGGKASIWLFGATGSYTQASVDSGLPNTIAVGVRVISVA